MVYEAPNWLYREHVVDRTLASKAFDVACFTWNFCEDMYHRMVPTLPLGYRESDLMKAIIEGLRDFIDAEPDEPWVVVHRAEGSNQVYDAMFTAIATNPKLQQRMDTYRNQRMLSSAMRR